MEDKNISENAASYEPDQQVEAESQPSLGFGQTNTEIKRLRGWYLIVIPLLIAGVFIFPANTNLSSALDPIFSGLHYDGVSYAILDYFSENQAPLPENWCDKLFELSERVRSYSDAEKSFPYTLNKNIIGQTEIPDNMVVLFEDEPGWNKIGGLESAKNKERLIVLLGNGNIKIFRKSQIPYLRWKYEDSGIIPEPDTKKPFAIFSLPLAIIFLCILIKNIKSLQIFWIFALGMGIISACIGAILGSAAEGFFYRLSQTGGDLAAPLFGGVWGFVIGVSFIAVIGSIYEKYKAKVSMVGYGIVIGIIIGIFASSIVHGYLMILYKEESFSYMLACSSFGIIAGFLLGWISSGVIRFYKKKVATGVENG